MKDRRLEDLATELSIYSRVLDSAGEQHSDRDISAIAFRLRLWVSQLDSLLEGTEQPVPNHHDQGTE